MSCEKRIHSTLEKRSEYRRAWPIMGDIFTVTLWEDDSAKAEMLIDALFQEVQVVDEKLNIERSDNEVAFIHRSAGQGPVALSDTLLDFFSTMWGLCQETHGLFDISVGPLVSLWGFDQPVRGEKKNIPPSVDIEKARKLVGCKKAKLDLGNKTLEIEKGSSFDLLFVQKGFVLDQAAEVLKEYNARSAKLTLGSLAYFFGSAPADQMWTYEVPNPKESAPKVAKLEVLEGAVVTLSENVRYFVNEEKKYGHVLDPRTGWPVRGIASVSVWSSSAVEATAWSRALFIAGYENGPDLIGGKKVSALWIRSTDNRPVAHEDVRFVDHPNAKITLLFQEGGKP